MFQRSLFEGSLEEAVEAPARKPVTVAVERNHSPSKSFSDNLEQFLQETIEELVEEKVEEMQASGIEAVRANKGRSKKPVIGLDLLIRSTVEESMVENDKKRITFTFEKEKVEKLREIADQERSRIRDIVEDLINNFIQSYQWNQG